MPAVYLAISTFSTSHLVNIVPVSQYQHLSKHIDISLSHHLFLSSQINTMIRIRKEFHFFLTCILVAASQYGTAMTLSSSSTTHMRTLSSTYPDGLFLKQTYILKNNNLMRLAMQEAEASGFKAIVITVDSVVRPQHRTLPLKDSEFLMTLLSKEENQ